MSPFRRWNPILGKELQAELKADSSASAAKGRRGGGGSEGGGWIRSEESSIELGSEAEGEAAREATAKKPRGGERADKASVAAGIDSDEEAMDLDDARYERDMAARVEKERREKREKDAFNRWRQPQRQAEIDRRAYEEFAVSVILVHREL